MQYAALIKQMLDVNRKTFENSMNVMVALQEHSEKMINDFWVKGSCLPEQSKKAVGDWVNHYKTGLSEYREHVGNRFKWMESYMLNSVDQMESSFNTDVEKTKSQNQSDDGSSKAMSVGPKTAVKKTIAKTKGAVTKKPNKT